MLKGGAAASATLLLLGGVAGLGALFVQWLIARGGSSFSQWWLAELRPDDWANGAALANMLHVAPRPVRVAPLILTVEDLSFAADTTLGTELVITLSESRHRQLAHVVRMMGDTRAAVAVLNACGSTEWPPCELGDAVNGLVRPGPALIGRAGILIEPVTAEGVDSAERWRPSLQWHSDGSVAMRARLIQPFQLADYATADELLAPYWSDAYAATGHGASSAPLALASFREPRVGQRVWHRAARRTGVVVCVDLEYAAPAPRSSARSAAAESPVIDDDDNLGFTPWMKTPLEKLSPEAHWRQRRDARRLREAAWGQRQVGAGAGTLLQVLIEGTLDEGLETLWLAVIPERPPCSASRDDATASDFGAEEFAAEMTFARAAAEAWWRPHEKAEEKINVSPLEYWSSSEVEEWPPPPLVTSAHSVRLVPDPVPGHTRANLDRPYTLGDEWERAFAGRRSGPWPFNRIASALRSASPGVCPPRRYLLQAAHKDLGAGDEFVRIELEFHARVWAAIPAGEEDARLREADNWEDTGIVAYHGCCPPAPLSIFTATFPPGECAFQLSHASQRC